MSGEDDSSGWQLTESDPGVFRYVLTHVVSGSSLTITFSELLKTLGVPLVVDDLYSLEAESLTEFQPISAFIFLFKWVQSPTSSMAGTFDSDFPGFFAHQVVNNACATLAVMNAIGNIPGLPMSPQLSDLISFTTGMDPQTRGMAITSSDWLREAHNALSPPSAVSLDGLGLPKTGEDAYHFIVYMPYMGSVYELDGLKSNPISHGSYSEGGEGWVARARYILRIFPESIADSHTREVIGARIATYPPGAVCDRNLRYCSLLLIRHAARLQFIGAS